MNCPICNVELKPADRQGIEIDYCPKCRGVWIAREELDRILAHPAPFDLDWYQNDRGREKLPTRSKYKVEEQGRGPKPGFWSNLFA
jgi:Zn-finger nucleic acid-binding protein